MFRNVQNCASLAINQTNSERSFEINAFVLFANIDFFSKETLCDLLVRYGLENSSDFGDQSGELISAGSGD